MLDINYNAYNKQITSHDTSQILDKNFTLPINSAQNVKSSDASFIETAYPEIKSPQKKREEQDIKVLEMNKANIVYEASILKSLE